MKKRHFVKHINKQAFSQFLLGADIGGTNTTFVVGGVRKGQIQPLVSLHYSTKDIKDFPSLANDVIKQVKSEYGINPTHACFAVAGPANSKKTSASLTNGKLSITVKQIRTKTPLKTVFLINDFDAVGYGINLLTKKDFYTLRHKKHAHKPVKHATKCVVGAGTGLGKSILTYNKKLDAYITHPSEGGHADFAPHNPAEMKLVEFIKKRQGGSHVSWEDVLCGRGIESIFAFLNKTGKYPHTTYVKEILQSADKPHLISTYQSKDKLCHATMVLFVQIYARCAKNFALDTLAQGGVYIAGGIAAKNKQLFRNHHFIKEFEHNTQHVKLLQHIPITIVTNYDVSLYGVLFAALHKKELMRA